MKTEIRELISECRFIDGHTHTDQYTGGNRKIMLSHIKNEKILTYNSATNPQSIKDAFQLNRDCPWILTAAGIHPWEAGHFGPTDIDALENEYRMAHQISEIGMDAVWAPPEATLRRQSELLEAQLILALKYNKPVTLHTKGAEDPVYDILKKWNIPSILIHWFDGSDRQLRNYMDLGCYFTIPPAVFTEKRSREILNKIPLNRLIPETDNPPAWPWLFNQQANVLQIRKVMKVTAGLLKISFEKMLEAFKENTGSFYML